MRCLVRRPEAAHQQAARRLILPRSPQRPQCKVGTTLVDTIANSHPTRRRPTFLNSILPLFPPFSDTTAIAIANVNNIAVTAT